MFLQNYDFLNAATDSYLKAKYDLLRLFTFIDDHHWW